MYCDKHHFDFTERLDPNWRSIRDELLKLPSGRFIPWKEKQLYESGRDVFSLYAFGNRDHAHCDLCPETTRLVESIPGLITAGFPSLKPGTHILPHVGYAYTVDDAGNLTRSELNNTVVRGHLGLVIPESYSGFGRALEVEDELHDCSEGQCVYFDDTVLHQVWNRTEGTRVVLLFDFQRPSHLSPATSPASR
jgi:aspartyl/asparaginyl beta-hydroxylase (cupin superfamily)